MENEEWAYINARASRDDRTRAHMVTNKAEHRTHDLIVGELPKGYLGSLRFGTYTQAEKLKIASVFVRRSIDRNNASLAFSVQSPHMGPVRQEEGPCITCNRTAPHCDGHYGCIVLPVPMYNPLTISNACGILNLFCHECGGARFDKVDQDDAALAMESGPARWERVAQKIGRGTCEHILEGGMPCHALHEKITHLQNKTSAFMIKRGKSMFSGGAALGMLKKVHPASAVTDLGFTSAEEMTSKFILESLLVPPNRSRDMTQTKALNTIMKDVLSFRKFEDDTFDNNWNKASCINDLYNDIAQLNAGSGKQYSTVNTRGLCQRLFNGKEGMPRAGMIRKRNFQAGYSVMTPYMGYPSVFAVPIIFQRKLNVTVTVCSSNRAFLVGLQKRQMITSVETADQLTGAYHDVKNIARYDLQMGDRVRRFLMDGDLINPVRTPTFGRQGMLVFRVKIWSKMTFGIFTPTYVGYAGDFDGDHMVGYVLSTAGARAEGLSINTIRNNYINCTSGFGVNGPHFNAPLACYYMSKTDGIEGYIIEKCLDPVREQPQVKTLTERLLLNNVPLDSGRAIFSACLPARLAYGNPTTGVYISMGCLVRGKLMVEHIRDGPDCITKSILEQYGPQAAEVYVYNITIVAQEFMSTRVVSVGINDMIQHQVDDAGNPICDELKRSFLARVMHHYDTESDPARLEEAISTENANFNNIMAQKIRDGSTKGVVFDYTDANVSKMAQNGLYINGIIGQQYIDSKRFEISRAFGNPDAWKLDPRNRGFVPENFADGMSAMSTFNHAQSTRKSLTDQNQSNEPGTNVLHIAAAVNNLVTTFMGSTMTIDGKKMIELVYGGAGLSTMRTWYQFPGKHYRTFMNLPCLAQRLLQERVAPGETDTLERDEFQVAVYSKAMAIDVDVYVNNVFDATRGILNRVEDMAHSVVSISDEAFQAGISSLADNQQGTPVYGHGTVVMPDWLYCIFVAPVKRDGDFRVASLHTAHLPQLTLILWHWRNIYYATKRYFSVENTLEFQSLVYDMAEWLEMEDVAPINPSDFVALFTSDLEPTIKGMTVFRRRKNVGIARMSPREGAYLASMRAMLARLPDTTDHHSLVHKVARREVCNQFSVLLLLAHVHAFPLAIILDKVLEVFVQDVRALPTEALYRILGGVFSNTELGRQAIVHMRYIRYPNPVNQLREQLGFLFSNIGSGTTAMPPGADVAPFFSLLTATDQFMYLKWPVFQRTAAMAATTFFNLLGMLFNRDIEVMLFKGEYLAITFSKAFKALRETQLERPSATYTTTNGTPFVLSKQDGTARQHGEHLVFQHYLFMFFWLSTGAGAIREGNTVYWELECLPALKKRKC